MTDSLDEHFRRLRRRERPPVYSLADKPIYDWLHAHRNEPPLSWLVLSINDIVRTMPVGLRYKWRVQVGATPLRLTKHIIPKFLRRIGMVQYPQVVRLLNGKRLRLWVRPNTIDTSHGYNVADQYEKVRDIRPSGVLYVPFRRGLPSRPLDTDEPERDVWDTDD